MNKSKSFWHSLQNVNTVVQILAGSIVIISVIWSIRNLVIEGLIARVPAWLVILVAILATISGIFIGKKHLKLKTDKKENDRNDLLELIEFNYEDADPKQHGWVVRNDEPETKGPSWRSLYDGKFGRVLEVKPNASYYMDYKVTTAGSMTGKVNLILKPGDSWSAYAKVGIVSNSGTESREVWLAIQIGNRKPVRRDWDNEWTIFVSGEPLNGGWVIISLNLIEEVAKTYGTEGWVYDQLSGIRFRGHLTLGKIELMKS